MRWDPADYMGHASKETQEDLVRLAAVVRDIFAGFPRVHEIDERVAIAWLAYKLGMINGNQVPYDLLEIIVQMRMHHLFR